MGSGVVKFIFFINWSKKIKKYFYFFSNICVASFLLSTLGISDVFSMHHEKDGIIEDNYHSSLNTHSPVEVEFIPFITDGDEKQEENIYIFIQKYLVQHETIPETQIRKILRFIVQCGGRIMGGLAGVPYFEVGRKAGGENEIIAWIIGGATTITVSGSGSWSYFNLLKNLDPQPPEEKNLLQKSKWTVPAHVSSHGLGLVGAVPTAYLAARFNTQKWLASISYGLEYSLKTNGFLTFFKKMVLQKNQVNQSLLEEDQLALDPSLLLPSLLVEHFAKKTIPSLIAMETEERNDLIAALYQEDNLTVESYLNSLLSIPSQSIFLEETPDTWKKGYPKKAFVGGLCFSALLNVVHNFHCAYSAWGMIYDHPAFIIPMASISVFPTFILEFQATVKTGGSLYDSSFYYASGVTSPSLSQSLYPRLMSVIPIVCASLAGVTTYVGRLAVIGVLNDFFPEKYAMFFSIGGVLGPFLFLSSANYFLVQELILSYTRSYGEESKKKLSLLVHDIEKLINVLSLASQEEMRKFLGNTNIKNTISILNSVKQEEAIQQASEINPTEESRKKRTNWCGIL